MQQEVMKLRCCFLCTKFFNYYCLSSYGYLLFVLHNPRLHYNDQLKTELLVYLDFYLLSEVGGTVSCHTFTLCTKCVIQMSKVIRLFQNLLSGVFLLIFFFLLLDFPSCFVTASFNSVKLGYSPQRSQLTDIVVVILNHKPEFPYPFSLIDKD